MRPTTEMCLGADVPPALTIPLRGPLPPLATLPPPPRHCNTGILTDSFKYLASVLTLPKLIDEEEDDEVGNLFNQEIYCNLLTTNTLKK